MSDPVDTNGGDFFNVSELSLQPGQNTVTAGDDTYSMGDDYSNPVQTEYGGWGGEDGGFGFDWEPLPDDKFSVTPQDGYAISEPQWGGLTASRDLFINDPTDVSSSTTMSLVDWRSSLPTDITPVDQKYAESAAQLVDNGDGTVTLGNLSGGRDAINKLKPAGQASKTTAPPERDNTLGYVSIATVAVTSLAGIIAQIWATKDAQDRSEAMWDKQAAEARAQMQYNRTGSWTGETTTSGGGGDSSTTTNWTPIKPTALT